MISKNKSKYILSLHNKKQRNEEKKFLVEGEKSIIEALQNSSFELDELFVSESFEKKHKKFLSSYEYTLATSQEINSCSTLSTNLDGIAIFFQKDSVVYQESAQKELVLVLDTIQDPGNLGTIIRIADWYGIKKIICSKNCVEFYSPKVIISSMGSFTRVEVYHQDLTQVLQDAKKPIYGAFMMGENIHTTPLEENGYLIIGNESNGISPELEKFVTKKITIPKFGHAESLNAGIATAIILDNIKNSSL